LRDCAYSLGKVGVLALALLFGMVLGRLQDSQPTVHAQERSSGRINCATIVPKSWGDFKGGSEYGLAFQDKEGNLRFLLHPSCNSVNSSMEPPAANIDLEVERK